MRIFIILILFSVIISCNPGDNDGQTSGMDSIKVDSEAPVLSEDFRTFSDQQFRFQLKHPQNWKIAIDQAAGKYQVINIYKPSEKAEEELPLRINSDPELTFISIFPQGYATELPFGKQKPFAKRKDDLSLKFNPVLKESMVFQLDNGEVWSYYIVPESTPGSWYDGFIYAQVAVEDFETTCFDETSGDTLSMQDCDPMTGDMIKSEGEVIQPDLDVIQYILNSFEFTMTENESEIIGNLIKVDEPLPNNDISKPLTISGKARGTWYFEGSFPVQLQDKDNNILAEVVAEAQGDWMTEEWVPFKASIKQFKMPDDERGYLVFQKDNPSGKPELDREFRLPVLFPPK